MSLAFAEPADLRAHYKAVRERLLAATVKPAPVPVARIIPVRKREVIGSRRLYNEAIGPIHPDHETMTQRATRLLAQVAYAHGYSPIDVKSYRREQPLVACRHEVCWQLKTQTTWSLPQIGKFLGGRDHTSVLFGIRKHQALVDGDVVMPAQRVPVALTAAEHLARRKARAHEAHLRRIAREKQEGMAK